MDSLSLDERRSQGSQASTSTSAPVAQTSHINEEDAAVPDGCIRHKVTKFDTLAGIAIKHNVSVADIKRVNGLLSDNALYARAYVLIPTEVVPMGEELQQLFQQVISGINRDPVLHSDVQGHPAGSAAERIAAALHVSPITNDAFPQDVPFSTAWLCQCGTCDISDPDGNCFKRPVELEMSERSSDGIYLPPTSAGPMRSAADAMRRRRAADTCSDSAEDFGWASQDRKPWSSMTRRQGPGSDSFVNGADTRLAQWFTDLGKAIGDSVQQTVQKVKDAANQPALARPLTSFSSAAEAVLAGQGPAGQRKGRGGMLGTSGLPESVPLPVSRKAAGEKYD